MKGPTRLASGAPASAADERRAEQPQRLFSVNPRRARGAAVVFVHGATERPCVAARSSPPWPTSSRSSRGTSRPRAAPWMRPRIRPEKPCSCHIAHLATCVSLDRVGEARDCVTREEPARKGSTVCSRADPAGQEFSPRSESHRSATAPRREARGHDRDPQGQPPAHAPGLLPSPVARHLQRVEEVSAMQTQRTGRGRAHPTVARTDARQIRRGAAALDAASNRASRQQPSRHGASTQGRRRRAHRRTSRTTRTAPPATSPRD